MPPLHEPLLRIHAWGKTYSARLTDSILFHGFGAVAVMLFVPLALDAVGWW